LEYDFKVNCDGFTDEQNHGQTHLCRVKKQYMSAGSNIVI